MAHSWQFERELIQLIRVVQQLLHPGESITFAKPALIQREYHYRFPVSLRDHRNKAYETSLDFRVNPRQPELLYFAGNGRTYDSATEKAALIQAIYTAIHERRVRHDQFQRSSDSASGGAG